MHRMVHDLKNHIVCRIPYVGLAGTYSKLTLGCSQVMSEPTVSSLKSPPLPTAARPPKGRVPSPFPEWLFQQATILPPLHLLPEHSKSRLGSIRTAPLETTHKLHHVICSKQPSTRNALAKIAGSRRLGLFAAAEAPSRLMPCVCQVRLKLVGVRIQTSQQSPGQRSKVFA